ncbi:MAG: aminopeptidase P family protein [Verrucomicrobia bacterium]|nr:MAG: aminopeptidase P family protein [Verrucomicrobiota bacterium]
MSPQSARLLFAATEQSADILYATRFFAPDPFIYLFYGGKSYVILSDLEVDRGRREAQVDEVIAYSELAAVARANLPSQGGKMSEANVLAFYLKKQGISQVEVPANFPLSFADILRHGRIEVRWIPDPFWPKREIKSAQEIQDLRSALRMTERAMERAFEVLRAAKIGKGGVLHWGNHQLTSEKLRTEIETCIVSQGGLASRTIVAGGQQAIDPHEQGSGPLCAHQLIILDIFPRHMASGYFGDMTRTVVRGHATDAQRHLWEICLEGQRRAFSQIRPRASGKTIQNDLKTFFAQNGYPTEQRAGRWTGFFHGAGHGLGLDLHEYPRFAATRFRANQVLTLEPGIYVPDLGGVRHEDVLLVTSTGSEFLTSLPKPLEL